MPAPADDVAAARMALGEDTRGRVTSAWAPGRCTILGDHVDYVGGRVLCCALDIGVAAAVAESADGRWRVSSDGVQVTREDLAGLARGDIADRALAAVEVALGLGASGPPLTIALSASVPAGAGLSSSAAVTCATLAAVLARAGMHTTPRRLAELAWTAEHDGVGVPCGRLDQRAVVEAPSEGLLDLDCATGDSALRPWPWPDVVLVIAASGERHDVGAADYAALRRDAEAVLREAGADTCQQLQATDLPALELRLQPRGRHLVDEVLRVSEAVAALDDADADALGRLLSAAHRAQAALLQASTPTIDRIVDAAETATGCFGARMVGAGFGGSVVALCRGRDAAACSVAMLAAGGTGGAAWLTRPSAGLAALSPELFEPDVARRRQQSRTLRGR